MPDTNDNAIEELFCLLDHVLGGKRHLATLTALVAERNGLKKRIAELESQPSSDLRERLVCAALTGLCADPSVDLDEAASKSAVAIADRTLAAMRKGGGA